MKYKIQHNFILFFILTLLSFVVIADEDEDYVFALVENTFSVVKLELANVNSNEDAVVIINHHLLNLLDLNITAQIVLGKYWRHATAVQKERFVNAFRELMIRTYSTFLVGDTAKSVQQKVIQSKRKGKTKIQVKTTVALEDRQEFAVNYLFRYNKKKKNWFVIDVNIDGISVALSFRTEYQNAIKTSSLDELIYNMELKNSSNNLKK